MNIFDIDIAMCSLIDDETGEIADYDAFMALQMERDVKIENTALWIKNLVAEGKAIREEEKALAERRRRAENRVESLKNYLAKILQGQKFKTAKTAISYRKSTAVEVDDDFVEWAKQNDDSLLTYKAPEPNKTAIKEILKDGGEVPHAALIERQNISIK